MEITLLVSPGGAITIHSEAPFIHKIISLEELEPTLQSLIENQKHNEQIEIEKEKFEDSLTF